MLQEMENISEIDIPEIKEQELEKELRETETKYSDLINLVKNRYTDKEKSDIANKEDMLKRYLEHNRDILKLSIELGHIKGFNQKEMGILKVSAILHDLTKADLPPKELADIPQYILIIHGERAAEEVKGIINDTMLAKILGNNYTQEEAEIAKARIARAIQCHMGPNPGFMQENLDGVNAKLRDRGFAEIQHPKPDKGDKVAETLLAADMCSLANESGREKILSIRSRTQKFRGEDQALCDEYQKFGITISLGEAALLSGFDSAYNARDMLNNKDEQEWINKAIEQSKQVKYNYIERGDQGEEINNYQVNYIGAITKRNQFVKAKETEKNSLENLPKAA